MERVGAGSESEESDESGEGAIRVLAGILGGGVCEGVVCREWTDFGDEADLGDPGWDGVNGEGGSVEDEGGAAWVFLAALRVSREVGTEG